MSMLVTLESSQINQKYLSFLSLRIAESSAWVAEGCNKCWPAIFTAHHNKCILFVTVFPCDINLSKY